jgi:hypothetical protein
VVNLDQTATGAGGSAQTRRDELDVVVDLIEEERPVRPLPAKLT